MRRMKNTVLILLTALVGLVPVTVFAKQDIVLNGVHEVALDLPRIYFQLRRDADGRPLGQQDESGQNYAFLDTGASGILLSSETAQSMGVSLDPQARFVDVGVGGTEYFKVSEPLHICLAGFESKNPDSQSAYKCFGPWRVQVKKESASLLGEPIDVIGMPVMRGNVIVLNPAGTNSMNYFAADIKNANSAAIPPVDFKIALRLKKFSNAGSAENIAPLPVSAGNPVIDGVIVSLRGNNSKGDWLLDTGATVSFISTVQAHKLGLTDEDGHPVAKVAFSVPVGGVGQMTQVNGYEIDTLTIPLMDGRKLIFKNARVGVLDIKYFDVGKNRQLAIDGVFGSNFLCASAKMEGMLPSDIGQTPFDRIVIDLRNNTLGFALRDNSKSAQ